MAAWILVLAMLIPPAGLAAAKTEIRSKEFAREDGRTGEATVSFVGDCSIGDDIRYRQSVPSYHWVLREKGYDVDAVLRDNDAYHALKAVDGLIVTGPTGTNVNDVSVALIG